MRLQGRTHIHCTTLEGTLHLTAHSHAQLHRGAFVQGLRVVTTALDDSSHSSDGPGKVCVVAGFPRRGLPSLEFKIFIFWLCWILVAACGKSLIFIVAPKTFSCSIQNL